MQTLKTLGCAALLCGLSLNAHAKEGGDQYPNGAEGFMAGALPPAGHYFINYAGYYGGTMHDPNGNKVDGVKVKAWFDALRYINVTKYKILGGDYTWHAILPLVSQEITTPAASESVKGLGDMTIGPFFLGWHWDEWHMLTGLDINLPTGRYDINNGQRSIGANYISYEPVLAFTYRNAEGWEASAKLMYNIKQENDDTKYQSGDEFHMDYTVGKHQGDWSYGLGGYYLTQTEDDELNGVKLDNSRGKVFAIGPQVAYNYKGMSFVFKWHHETSIENRFGGNKVFFKFITRL